MKLNTKAFALACGLVWGIGLMLITWWIMLIDGATGEITFIGKVYRGYSISLGGSFMGLVWGLIDGAIGGAILAGVYNYFAGRFTRQ